MIQINILHHPAPSCFGVHYLCNARTVKGHENRPDNGNPAYKYKSRCDKWKKLILINNQKIFVDINHFYFLASSIGKLIF
ncbi:MAG: hypothetical protein JWQ30_2815 [Sediminibacterium sp.]|nr:hypothetical protein [Sediminibacterium sp.]